MGLTCDPAPTHPAVGDVLRAIPIDEVSRIEYVSTWEAAKRYGSGFGTGIVVVAKRARGLPR
jgi:hypothetical protein